MTIKNNKTGKTMQVTEDEWASMLAGGRAQNYSIVPDAEKPQPPAEALKPAAKKQEAETTNKQG